MFINKTPIQINAPIICDHNQRVYLSNQSWWHFVIFFLLFMARFSVEAGQTKQDLPQVLTIEKAIKIAQSNDPWIIGNVNLQRSVNLKSRAADRLSDPRISIGLVNVPSNEFDFETEGMTQTKIGITQMFPRGDVNSLKSLQLKTQSEAYPFQRQDRRAKVAVTVGTLWLDIYRVNKSIELIEHNRSLFEQLADVAEASYASAVGNTRQQDIVRAQLELTRLDDRLAALHHEKNNIEGLLLPWFTSQTTGVSLDQATTSTITSKTKQNAALNTAYQVDILNVTVSETLPKLPLSQTRIVHASHSIATNQLAAQIASHPSILAIERTISATKMNISLAEQRRKPQWGVNASYGHREDDVNGNSRANLFSVGVTFDVPLFSTSSNDHEVKAAVSKTESIKTEKQLKIRQLLGAYASAKGRLLRLKERQTLYDSRLMPQVHDQAEAALTAYTSDDGDFSDVVRARIAVLNAEIDHLTLNVAEQKLILELNYIFAGNNQSLLTPNSSSAFTNQSSNTFRPFTKTTAPQSNKESYSNIYDESNDENINLKNEGNRL